MGKSREILQDRHSVSYREGAFHHSVTDIRGVSLTPYIHALYGLVRQTRARHVLMIGCGGGSLATMLARAGVMVTVVDNDPVSFQIARQYFHMPARVICVAGDGAAFLRGTEERYDAIILDAYAGGRVPRHLVTRRFFASVKRQLVRGGFFAMNVILQDDEDVAAERIGYRLKTMFRRVRLLDDEGELDRNAILVAGAVGEMKPPRLMRRPKRSAAVLRSALKALQFRTF